MTCDFEINGRNARNEWGVVLGDGSLAALMTPAPLKDYIENESVVMHGTIIVNAASAMPKVASREVQLTVYLYANSTETFYARYQAFVGELQKGLLTVRTKYQADVYYRLYYLSCTQFSQFNGRLAKFIIRFNEPNPMNRDAAD